MDPTNQQRNRTQIEAAYVVLYDCWNGSADSIVPLPLAELIVYSVRRQILLSRTQAQAELRDMPGSAAAALVLAYESWGARRLDPAPRLSSQELAQLRAVREQIPCSLRRALSVLAASNGTFPPLADE
jgi:hypothetical protein